MERGREAGREGGRKGRREGRREGWRESKRVIDILPFLIWIKYKGLGPAQVNVDSGAWKVLGPSPRVIFLSIL